MKNFDVPIFYRSPLIAAVKKKRKEADKMKRDFSPTLLDFGPLQIYLARHFGFCYGVENAIDIAFKTIADNPGKRVFFLSEMIHNPQVNADLQASGVTFLQDNEGKQLIPFEDVTADDIVLIPAFGTTLAIEAILKNIGIQVAEYNTTCPFVEKVWNRSEAIAKSQYTIIIHGKPNHEETRATFSHAAHKAPAVVVRDMEQTKALVQYITGERPAEEFYTTFQNQFSDGFDVTQHLQRIGVVNQTTMLASDTQAIADLLKETITAKYGLDEASVKNHFADTRDTLCYATLDNQSSVQGMLPIQADLAIVVGGYNSSNTSHLVELFTGRFPVYFINSADKLLSSQSILHYDLHQKMEIVTQDYLPRVEPAKILITSGASCPDALVEGVINKLTEFFPATKTIEEVLTDFS